MIDLPFSWATDIHLDHVGDQGLEEFAATVVEAGKPLLLTGDISDAHQICQHLSMLETLTQLPLWFVLGNHDYYGSSVAVVADRVRQAVKATEGRTVPVQQPYPRLHYPWVLYLQDSGGVEVMPDEYLVGVDGYADGRAGNLSKSNVYLNDYNLCSTFASARGNYGKIGTILANLGRASAVRFNNIMAELPAGAKRVYIATHAPPFEEAHFAPDGKEGDDNWSPHFVNVSLGNAILAWKRTHPDIETMILCGHTHTGARVRVAGIEVLVGQASYGKPQLQDPSSLPRRRAAFEDMIAAPEGAVPEETLSETTDPTKDD